MSPSANSSTMAQVADILNSQNSGGSGSVSQSVGAVSQSVGTISHSVGTVSHSVGAHDGGVGTPPNDTDLIFLPGSNKVMLTVQRPVVRAVIQDAIERVHAALMFSNAFPDVFDTLKLISNALVAAADFNDQATTSGKTRFVSEG